MAGIDDCFSGNYAEARRKFLDSASGLVVCSHLHPLVGLDGEQLALDVLRDGARDAERLLIVSSACHGVEGFCGSGIQISVLRDPEWREYARRQRVAVLYLHALNPFGFSHLRRVTQENVDLNRNFQDFRQPLPINPAYAEVHALLLPPRWPPGQDHPDALAGYVEQHGIKALQAAISGGQHTHPDGLFFGGTLPTWSNLQVRSILREHGGRVRRLAWVDLHSGLGPAGHGERIFAGRDGGDELARARAWWDGGGSTPVTSIRDGSSSSPPLTGLMTHSAYEECPQAEVTALALEFGTQPIDQVLQALRADHWLHLHPEARPDQAQTIRRQMRDAFYVDNELWRARVVAQAREALVEAIGGLARSQA